MAKSDLIAPCLLEVPRVIRDAVKKSVRIECKLRAKPDAQIKWLRDKKELINGKKHKLSSKKEPDGTFTLTLEVLDLAATDAGLYKLEARNESGQSNAHIHMTVDEAPAGAAKPAADPGAPAFKEKPKDQVGIDGDRITVTCKVAGTPRPDIVWYKNKQAIKKSKDFSMEINGDIAKLTIADAYPDDSGDYMCELVSDKGRQTANFRITIKEKKGKMKRIRPAESGADKPTPEIKEPTSNGNDASKNSSILTYDETYMLELCDNAALNSIDRMYRIYI